MEAFFAIKVYPKINIALKIHEKINNLHKISSRFCLTTGINENIYILLSRTKPHCSTLNTTFQHYINTQTANDFCTTKYTSHKEIQPTHQNIELQIFTNTQIDLESNLIYKAYQTLLQVKPNYFPLTKKHFLNIYAQKRIPIGGGLGGGSANAAITLLVLNQILEFHYDLETLYTCAKKLGSDVPFFIFIYSQNTNTIAPYFISDISSTLQPTHQNTTKLHKLSYASANVFGTGDIIEPFSEELLPLTIHCNHISCNTGLVFQEFAKSYASTPKTPIDFTQDSKTLLTQHDTTELNDLYAPACNLYPLQEIRQNLLTQYKQIYFSGSGSSFFSLQTK